MQTVVMSLALHQVTAKSQVHDIFGVNSIGGVARVTQLLLNMDLWSLVQGANQHGEVVFLGRGPNDGPIGLRKRMGSV